MSQVSQLHAREIIDSRGNPTVEVEVTLSNGIMARAAVPSGASTGAHEAVELRDKNPKRFRGKGVQVAVENVKSKIFPRIKGLSVREWKKIDSSLNEIDGTKNKSQLGANAILGVSLACARAAAQDSGQSLFEFLSPKQNTKLPVPLMNVLNGGAHANNGLDVQEFMIVPVLGDSFKEALRAGCEVFQCLKETLSEKKLSTAVGDEGGFAPVLEGNKKALELLMMAIERAGYKPGEQIALALDVAATELYDGGKYEWEGEHITAKELGSIYTEWSREFPLVSIEDGFAEDDWQGWIGYTEEMGKELQLVGDDLFVTNVERLKQGIEKKAANALLVKVNQIGSLSETLQAVQMAQGAKYHTVMSHRSGETEDTTIADLAVAFGSEQIKTGSLCRSERTAKYNQLLRIQEQLGARAEYWGGTAFK